MRVSPDVGKQCVILVGGLGTRLGALTEACPKPLLQVAGRPFLEYLLRNIRRYGYDDFVLLAGYRGDMVSLFASSALQTELGCRIRVIVEPEPMGTGGALRYAAEALQERFLLLNGDSFFDFNLLDLATRPVSGEATARIALRRLPDASRFGIVELIDDRIVAFRERPEKPGPGLVNGGVYELSRDILQHIGQGVCSLERDIFPILAAKQQIAGFVYEGFFLDIGIPEDFARAQTDIPETMRRPAVFFDRDGVLNHDSGYTYKIEDFRWMDGAAQAIRMLNDLGWYVFVVTNQAGVARGYYGEAEVQKLHAWMNEDLYRIGAHIDDFRYCPHHVEGTVEEYTRACTCRKPEPGMILDLIDCWPMDIQRSVLIGDKESDMEAAKAAGVKGVKYTDGNISKVIRNYIV